MRGTIGIVVAVTLSAAMGITHHKLDGSWWKESSENMRRGAVDGISDCLIWERSEKLPALSAVEFVGRVDNYYEHNSAQTPVDAILLSLPKDPSKASPGGEDYSKEKHGYFDGMYWRSSDTEQQEGFIVGYISCRSGTVPNKTDARTAVTKVTSWYKSHTSSSEWDTKIPDVLDRVGKLRSEPKAKATSH